MINKRPPSFNEGPVIPISSFYPTPSENVFVIVFPQTV